MEFLKPKEVYIEVDKILPLPFHLSTRNMKKRSYPILDIIRFYNLQRLNERRFLGRFESFDYNKRSLELVYDFIFKDQMDTDGDVIYASWWNWEKGGYKMLSSELKNFFMNEHENIYDHIPDFYDDTFFFFFLDQKRIVVYVADNIAFEISPPKDLSKKMLSLILSSLPKET